MPQFHRSTCRACNRTADEAGGRISGTGYCPECGERRHLEHNAQLRAHSGPWFDHWRQRMAATFSLGALDGPPRSP